MSLSTVLSRRQAITALTAAACLTPFAEPFAQSAGSTIVRAVPRVILPVIVGCIIFRCDDWFSRGKSGSEAAPVESEAAKSAREAAEREAAQREAEKPIAQALADYAHGDLMWAQEAVRTIGKDIVQKALDRRLTVWPQTSDTVTRHFDVTITNQSRKAVASRLHITIDDLATGDPDFNFPYRGYRCEPRSTLRYEAPFEAAFARPGLKRISVINQPTEVRTQPVEMLVVPGNIIPASEAKKPA